MKMRLFQCNICGNMVAMVEDSGAPIVCCGQEMEEVLAGSVDASREKHVPVCGKENGMIQVRVGSEPHPMTEKHYIMWIGVETNKGFHSKQLSPGTEPAAEFRFSSGEKPETMLAYCNLHGLWQASCGENCSGTAEE